MSMAARRQETAVVLPTLWFPVIAGPCGHTTLTSSTLTRTDSRRYGRVIQSQKDVVLLRKIDMENVIFLCGPLCSPQNVLCRQRGVSPTRWHVACHRVVR